MTPSPVRRRVRVETVSSLQDEPSPDLAREYADACSLLEIALEEAQRVRPVGERLSRFESARNYAPPPGRRVRAGDPAFRTSDAGPVESQCRKELQSDIDRRRAVSYGPALLQNEIGADGRIAGPVVFVADLAEHNEALRVRFGDRPWYRLTFVNSTPDAPFELVPYR